MRQWNTFAAALYETPGGVLEDFARSSYVVVMHVGYPLVSRSYTTATRKRGRTIGDIDVVPPGCRAELEFEGPATVLTVSLSPALLRSAAETIDVDLEQATIERRTRIRDPRLQHIGWALKEELEAPEPADGAFGESLGTALAIHLIRAYSRRTDAHAAANQRPELRRAFEYIEQHLDGRLTLAEIAAAACVSVPNLKRLFKATANVSVHRYVIARRVAHATVLLKDGRLPLKEVAQRAGFCDQSHMTRWMRRVAGATPARMVVRRGDAAPLIA